MRRFPGCSASLSPHLLDARCKSIEDMELVNALCRLPSMQSANLLNERESLWGAVDTSRSP